MKKSLGLIVLLLSTCLSRVVATDYVDKINNAFKGSDGQHVIYEMNVGAFTDAGTFAAAQERLSELKQLGVDIVWLMPIYPRGGGINSPYAPTDYQAVNPSYGTIADLKAFVAAAHALQMQVWLDWVPNHTATDATWVTSHPEYYVQSGGQMVHPNNYSDVYQLNYNNADLANAMTDALKFWIDQTDIDGYRCDYISSSYIPASYWQSAIPEIKTYKSGKTITFLGEADIAKDATRLKDVGFDYDYAWDFQSSLASFGSGDAAARPKAFVNTLMGYQNDISFSRMVYLTNHDQNYNETQKTLTQKYGDNRYPLTVLSFTAWGMPLIYNGQEIGGNQALNYFTDEKVSWNSVDKKMQNTIRTLCALKHDIPAFHDGKTAATNRTLTWLSVTGNTSLLAYTCQYGDSKALVLLNFGTSAASVSVAGITAGTYGLWLDSETVSQGVSRKTEALTATSTFNIDAKGYRVYVKGSFSTEELPAPEVYTPTLDSNDEISIFFETATEANYQIWAWGNGLSEEQHLGITGSWGDRPSMTLMGNTANGNYIYKFVFKGSVSPEQFIITRNGDSDRPFNETAYVRNGYYVEGITTPTQVISALTGISALHSASIASDDRVYTLSGIEVTGNKSLPRGIYIKNGKKLVVK